MMRPAVRFPNGVVRIVNQTLRPAAQPLNPAGRQEFLLHDNGIVVASRLPVRECLGRKCLNDDAAGTERICVLNDPVKCAGTIGVAKR